MKFSINCLKKARRHLNILFVALIGILGVNLAMSHISELVGILSKPHITCSDRGANKFYCITHYNNTSRNSPFNLYSNLCPSVSARYFHTTYGKFQTDLQQWEAVNTGGGWTNQWPNMLNESGYIEHWGVNSSGPNLFINNPVNGNGDKWYFGVYTNNTNKSYLSATVYRNENHDNSDIGSDYGSVVCQITGKNTGRRFFACQTYYIWNTATYNQAHLDFYINESNIPKDEYNYNIVYYQTCWYATSGWAKHRSSSLWAGTIKSKCKVTFRIKDIDQNKGNFGDEVYSIDTDVYCNETLDMKTYTTPKKDKVNFPNSFKHLNEEKYFLSGWQIVEGNGAGSIFDKSTKIKGDMVVEAVFSSNHPKKHKVVLPVSATGISSIEYTLNNNTHELVDTADVYEKTPVKGSAVTTLTGSKIKFFVKINGSKKFSENTLDNLTISFKSNPNSYKSTTLKFTGTLNERGYLDPGQEYTSMEYTFTDGDADELSKIVFILSDLETTDLFRTLTLPKVPLAFTQIEVRKITRAGTINNLGSISGQESLTLELDEQFDFVVKVDTRRGYWESVIKDLVLTVEDTHGNSRTYYFSKGNVYTEGAREGNIETGIGYVSCRERIRIAPEYDATDIDKEHSYPYGNITVTIKDLKLSSCNIRVHADDIKKSMEVRNIFKVSCTAKRYTEDGSTEENTEDLVKFYEKKSDELGHPVDDTSKPYFDVIHRDSAGNALDNGAVYGSTVSLKFSFDENNQTSHAYSQSPIRIAYHKAKVEDGVWKNSHSDIVNNSATDNSNEAGYDSTDDGKSTGNVIYRGTNFYLDVDGAWKFKIVNKDVDVYIQDIDKNVYKVTADGDIDKLDVSYYNNAEVKKDQVAQGTYEMQNLQSSFYASHYDILAIRTKLKPEYEGTGFDLSTVVISTNEDSYLIFELVHQGIDSDGRTYIDWYSGGTNVTNNTTLKFSMSRFQYDIGFKIPDNTEKISGTSTLNMADVVKIMDTSETILNTTNASTVKVTHGNDFEFKLSVNYRYQQSAPNMSVYFVPYKMSNGREVLDNDNKTLLMINNEIYTMPYVKEKGVIQVEGLQLNRYNLNFVNTDKVTFCGTDLSHTNIGNISDFEPKPITEVVKYGETYKFNIKIYEGYTLDGSEITANDMILRVKSGEGGSTYYELSNINSDFNIDVKTLQETKCLVSFPSLQGAYFTDAYETQINFLTPLYHNSCSFRVKINSEYSQSESNIVVLAYNVDEDGNKQLNTKQALPKDYSGNYVLSNVEGNYDIEVENLAINKYTVDFPVDEDGVVFSVQKNSDDKYDFQEVSTENGNSPYVVSHGDTIVFSVTAKEGYDVSNVKISEKDDFDVNRTEKGYVIQNISRNLKINISNIDLAKHTITFNGDHAAFKVDLTSDTSVKTTQVLHKENMVFFIELDEGYFKVPDFDANGNRNENAFCVVQTSPIEKILYTNNNDMGRYILENVSSDATIEVRGIEIMKFDVTLPTDDLRIKFYDIYSHDKASLDSRVLPSVITISYNDSVNFEIIPEYGYDISNLKVTTAEGVTVVTRGTGVYNIPNIKQNLSVEVDHIELAKYRVNLKGENITFYDEHQLYPINDVELNYQQGLTTFKLVVNSGYDLDINNGVIFYIGDDYSIPVHPNDSSQDASQIIITGPDDDGIFTLTNVTRAITLRAGGATKHIYNITFPTDTTGLSFEKKNDNGIGRAINPIEKAEYLSEFSFNINAKKGYDTSYLNVTVVPYENAIINNVSGGYIISQITGDITINVSDVNLLNYTVKYTGNGIDYYSSDNTQFFNSHIDYGGSVKFQIKGQEGYNIAKRYNVTIINNDNLKILEDGIRSRYGDDLEDANNEIKRLTRKDYDNTIAGTIVSDNGVRRLEYNGDNGFISQEVTDSTKLNISLNDFIDENGQKVAGTTLSEVGRFTYEITNIQGNITILIDDVAKGVYKIVMANLEGASFKHEFTEQDTENNNRDILGSIISEGNMEYVNEANVKDGENYVFYVEAKEGFDISNATVYANGVPISMIDGRYTLETISRDTSITIDGIVSTRVSISLKYTSGVKFTDVNGIELSTLDKIYIDRGQTYQFKVSLLTGYEQSKDRMVVKSTKSEVTFNRGIYTLTGYNEGEGILDNTEVIVENVELNTYAVKLNYSEGGKYIDKYGKNELENNQTVRHGENFSFIVQEKEGYNISDLIVYVTPDGSDRMQLSAIDGVYTIYSAETDYLVIIENIVRKSYKLELRATDGVNFLDTAGNILKGTLDTKHGDDFIFRISLDSAYDQSTPIVKVKGSQNAITPVGSLYTVANISGDNIVEVSNVKKNTYKITFVATEGVIYKNAKNKVFTDSQEIEYGGTLPFKVVLRDAYDNSNPVVLLDGEKPLLENAGVYELSNITSDSEITVKEVYINREDIVINEIQTLQEDIKNLTLNQSIESESDVNSIVAVTKEYLDLTDDEKPLVSNSSDLNNAQRLAADYNHTSNDVSVSGLDWNIKVVATPNDDESNINRLNEKMARKEVLSLYDIKLSDVLTGKEYEVPYGDKVSVVIPAPDLTGYKNYVVVHEKDSGSIEYLDLLINDGYAKFDTTSFSLFGIAAKEIPNYNEQSSNTTISFEGVNNLPEVEKLLLDDTTSQLGDVLNDVDVVSDTDKIISTLLGETDDSWMGKVYNWIINNELYVILIAAFLLAIVITIAISVYNRRNI